MKKINIKIPNNLTPEQEVFAIAKQLNPKLLGTNQKLIGGGVEFKSSELQINIIRQPVEKTIQTHKCPCCQTVFGENAGKSLWVNYGGTTRRNYYCSDNCRGVIMQIAGEGRVAIKRNELKPLRFF